MEGNIRCRSPLPYPGLLSCPEAAAAASGRPNPGSLRVTQLRRYPVGLTARCRPGVTDGDRAEWRGEPDASAITRARYLPDPRCGPRARRVSPRPSRPPTRCPSGCPAAGRSGAPVADHDSGFTRNLERRAGCTTGRHNALSVSCATAGEDLIAWLGKASRPRSTVCAVSGIGRTRLRCSTRVCGSVAAGRQR